MSSEEKSLLEGEPRVKFTAKWKGGIDSLGMADLPRQIAAEIADAVWELEQCGVTPVLPDGKTGGNAAAVLTTDGDQKYLMVTKSGKLGSVKMDVDNDFCVVTKFDPETWETEYYAANDSVLPTSDTPLHYASLIVKQGFDWSVAPSVALHGHALASEEDAEKFGFPISAEETVCSTKEDTQCFTNLLSNYNYPKNKVFIRKDHGFLLLGDNVQNALDTFRSEIKPRL